MAKIDKVIFCHSVAPNLLTLPYKIKLGIVHNKRIINKDSIIKLIRINIEPIFCFGYQ